MIWLIFFTIHPMVHKRDIESERERYHYHISVTLKKKYNSTYRLIYTIIIILMSYKNVQNQSFDIN